MSGRAWNAGVCGGHGQLCHKVEVLPCERSRCLIELLIRTANGPIRGQIELLENFTTADVLEHLACRTVRRLSVFINNCALTRGAAAPRVTRLHCAGEGAAPHQGDAAALP